MTDISKTHKFGKTAKERQGTQKVGNHIEHQQTSSRPKQVWNVYSAVYGGRKLDK